jgi:hypothetical protein
MAKATGLGEVVAADRRRWREEKDLAWRRFRQAGGSARLLRAWNVGGIREEEWSVLLRGPQARAGMFLVRAMDDGRACGATMRPDRSTQTACYGAVADVRDAAVEALGRLLGVRDVWTCDESTVLEVGGDALWNAAALRLVVRVSVEPRRRVPSRA